MNFNLSGKTILVTGASSGIGRQIAIACSEMGATVIALGRDEERLNQTVSALVDPERHLSYSVDLLEFEAIETTVKEAVAKKGKIHGLVNCAGISATLPLRVLSTQKMELFFQTNVQGAMNMTKIVTRPAHINDTGAGVIFIASVMAVVGEVGKSVYAMTKGALLAASRSLALELAPKNIRVNCISPGVVDTPMSKNAVYSRNAEALNHIKSLHPLGIGRVEDVANACVFLLSDEARWITGTNLIVDGGYTAR
jgi:NAD(P)-dependent dehydrogenase (short-subunit alcohol dehydrogenase family)